MSMRSIQLSFFFLVSGLTAIIAFFIFQPYIKVLVLAATFAVLFYPLYKKFINNRLGKKFPSVASLLVVLIAAILVFTPLTLLGIRVFNEATTIYVNLNDPETAEYGPLGNIPLSSNETINNFREKIEGLITNLTTNFDYYVQGGLRWIIDNSASFFKSVASFGLAIFLWFLSFYYFLRDGEKIKNLFIALSPLSDRYDMEIVQRIGRAIKSVIGGSIVVAIIQGILAGIGFFIFNVPGPTLWGMVAVIAALVPTVGTALVMLPGVAYLFLTGENVGSLGLLLWAIFIVGTIDNVLRPKLIERGIQIHPLIILLSVLGGIGLFGPIGFLIGPLVISLLSEFFKIYKEMVVEQKN